jgi:hypothetical protein
LTNSSLTTGATFPFSVEPLWSRAEVLKRPSPVPKACGIYAWYFDELPSRLIDASKCVVVDSKTLLYIGIAPSRLSISGKLSKSTIRSRLRTHYAGNAEGSTLRLSLGCLLAGTLGLRLTETRSGRRVWGPDGEAILSDWLGEHAYVAWEENPVPWLREHDLIQSVDLPLNLVGNQANPFHAVLAKLRSEAKAAATRAS